MLINTSGIYAIQTPSGKRYIGSAQNLARRRSVHFHRLRKGLHHCAGLQRAFDKYGEAQLVFSVIEHCAVARLIEREQYHLDCAAPRSLYNARKQADSNLGLRQSPETRAKLSAAHTGKEHTQAHKDNVARAKRAQTPETRAKISAALKGRPMSDAARAALLAANAGRSLTVSHIEKIRKGNAGKSRSAETRAKIAAARTGKKHSPATLDKLRKPCAPETKAKIAAAQRRRHAERAIVRELPLANPYHEPKKSVHYADKDSTNG